MFPSPIYGASFKPDEVDYYLGTGLDRFPSPIYGASFKLYLDIVGTVKGVLSGVSVPYIRG